MKKKNEDELNNLNCDIWKIYLIYRIDDNGEICNKVYIGQTCRSINKRFQCHITDKKGGCIKLFNAFNKYGRENFRIITLAETKCHDCANYLEATLINQYDSINNGYNIRNGGSNGKLSEETKKKISQSRIGKYTGENSSFYGRHHTEENRKKISELTKARVQGEDNPFFGKKHTEETKKILVEMTKARVQGEDNPMFGKTHSPETIKKISQSRIGKTAGKNNPMYGKRHPPELLKQIAESHKGQVAWNKGIPNSEAAREKMKLAWVKRRAQKELAKQMKNFYGSTIGAKLDLTESEIDNLEIKEFKYSFQNNKEDK